MAITAESDVYTALGQAMTAHFAAPLITAGAGQLVSNIRQWVTPAASAATPSVSGAALDKTFSGALPIFGSGASKSNYVAGLTLTQTAASSVPGQMLILYDRLVETGGLDGTLTSSQTVNSVALPARATGGDGVECWIEIYTTLGGTAATATVSYTNQAGTAGQTGTSVLPGGVRFATCWPVSLAAGDTGVRSVQSVTLSASTLTAGNFGFTLRKQIGPMIHFGLRQNQGVGYGWADTGLAKIPDDACVEVCVLAAQASTNAWSGWMQTIQA